jgi:hypothetical protein
VFSEESGHDPLPPKECYMSQDYACGVIESSQLSTTSPRQTFNYAFFHCF